jgi:hypothetical protein
MESIGLPIADSKLSDSIIERIKISVSPSLRSQFSIQQIFDWRK